MVRNNKKTLARGKGPPGEDQPSSDGNARFAATKSFETRTINFNQSPSEETKLLHTLRSPEQEPRKYVIVYEDDDGNIQCSGSEGLQGSLDSTRVGRLCEVFREVCDVPEDSEWSHLTLAREPTDSKGPEDVSLKYEDDREIKEEEEDINWHEPQKHQTVSVADTQAIHRWYNAWFELIQSLPCKAIAKAWILKINPRKSIEYPYNGGKIAKKLRLEKKDKARHKLAVPPWWPEHVPHKEPDHLDKWNRIDLLFHILTGMFGMRCGVNQEPLNVKFLRDATLEIEVKIKRMKNGKRSWDLLGQLYNKREVEEDFLRGGRNEKSTISLPWYPPTRRPKSTSRVERPRKERKLDDARNWICPSTRSQDDSESDASSSECWDDYEEDDPFDPAPPIKQERQEDPPDGWTNPLDDNPEAFPLRAEANQTQDRHHTESFFQAPSPSQTFIPEPHASSIRIEYSGPYLYPSFDAGDECTMSGDWDLGARGRSERDATRTLLPPLLKMSDSAVGNSSTTAPYQWPNASTAYHEEAFPHYDTGDCHTAFSDQQAVNNHSGPRSHQYSFPLGVLYPFHGHEPHKR